MREIIHWYNKNRKLIWKVIGIFIVIIVVIQLLDRSILQEQKRKQESIAMSESNVEQKFNSIILEDNKSTITGDNISKSQTNSLKVLDEFINYCNKNKVNEAYDLLSEDCKKEMYPTIETFKKIYYDKIFKGGQKNISVENWVGNIYKVKFMEDALSTGMYNTVNIQDYITIIEDEYKNIKININNYIGKNDVNIQKDYDNIKIKVLEKHKYIDFETYVFEITNNSDNTILLNDSNNTDTMYIEDSNNLKYSAYIHELSEAELKLISGETKRVTIKYYNKYSSSKKIKNIVFSKIILNYIAYTNQSNIGYYNDYGKIQINL